MNPGVRVLGRYAVVLVWLCNGLWCKVMAGCPVHAAVVSSLPWWGLRGSVLLVLIGAAETALAVWVLSGRRPRLAAATQTVLLGVMNIGALLWGRSAIADPAGMVVQNLAFLALVWIVAQSESNE